MDPELETVKAEARRLRKRAIRWGVELPQEWSCSDEDDFESFICGIHHDNVRAKIQNAKWAHLTGGVGLIGGILGIVAFVRSC
jgi:hypothetical protein